MIRSILKNNYIYILLLVILTIFFVISFNINYLSNIIYTLDNKVIDFITSIQNVYLTFIYKIFTFLGNIYIPSIIIVCIFVFKKNKNYLYILSSSYILSGILSLILKFIIARPRPLNAIINMPKSYSFPSGHTLTSIVFYLIFCYLMTIRLNKSKKIIFYIISILFCLSIGMSRIYLGVHFFSDVIGGILYGSLLVIMIINIVEKNFKRCLK